MRHQLCREVKKMHRLFEAKHNNHSTRFQYLSPALMFTANDYGDINSSPCPTGMDMSDQMLLPALGYSAFDGFNYPSSAISDEINYKSQNLVKDERSPGACSVLIAPPTEEFDYLSKVETKVTFSPEYAAVETPTNELFASIFRNAYLPKSRKAENSNSSSNVYAYGATPPSFPCMEVPDEKPDVITYV